MEFLRKLCEWKGVEIIEGEICSDHIYAGKYLAQNERFEIYRISERKSALMIFQK